MRRLRGHLQAWMLMILAISCQSIPEEPVGPTGSVDSSNSLAYIGISETVRLSLFIIHDDSDQPRPLVADGADFEDPAFSPDGRTVAVASNRSGFWRIELLDLNTLELSTLTTSEFRDFAPAFSPNGRQIAFQRQLDNELDWDIFVIDIDGGNLRNLTNAEGPDRRPTWSPEGTQIAYQHGPDRLSQEIWVMDADGRNARALTPERPGITGAPCWSPDGTTILFESSAHQGDVAPTFFVEYDLYTIKVDGSDLTRIGPFSGPGVSARLPKWSPEGNRIAFEFREVRGTFGASRFRIRILDTRNNSIHEVQTGGTSRKPAWSPLSST